MQVIRPEDISLNGHVLMVDSFRSVAGMYVTRGVEYDDFVTIAFSGSATEKFLTIVDGREVLQLMGGTINWTTEDLPLAILDRVEIIRGPGASIWGTNAVSGVVNVVTKHAAATQGNNIRLIIEDDGTFLGEFHGGQISEDSFYRVWVRDQEYSEGELMSGLPARDDGYARKAGFRFDKELAMDLDLTIAGGFAARRVDHVLDLTYRLFHANGTPFTLPDSTQWPWLRLGFPPCDETLPWSTLKGAPAFHLLSTVTKTMKKCPRMRLRAKLSGITDGDLDWSLAGYADCTTLRLDMSVTVGSVKNSISTSKRISLLEIPTISLSVSQQGKCHSALKRLLHGTFRLLILSTGGTPKSGIPKYSNTGLQLATQFKKIAGFFQDSMDLSDRAVLSLGAKFEDSDSDWFNHSTKDTLMSKTSFGGLIRNKHL